MQFGTGAFLRGFVDHFLDAANRAGRFGGRVVMVGSTGSGRDQALNDQDGLYTLSVQGIETAAPRREHRVIGSVSRALSATDEWAAVLACARNPELELVFSNTTEVGIALDEEDGPDLDPPRSFPGKLDALPVRARPRLRLRPRARRGGAALRADRGQRRPAARHRAGPGGALGPGRRVRAAGSPTPSRSATRWWTASSPAPPPARSGRRSWPSWATATACSPPARPTACS